MKTLIERIAHWANVQPEKMVAAFKKDALTYRQLNDRILGMAAVLHEMGVVRGAHVAFSALSKPEMIVTYLGIQAAGGVAVFLDKNATPQNMAAIADDAEAVLLLTDKPMKGIVPSCPVLSLKETVTKAEEVFSGPSVTAIPAVSTPSVRPSDLAELIYTTGTTGKPKGVMLSYGAVYHIMLNTASGVGIQNDERILLPLPLNHSYALRVLRAALWQGATVILQNGFTFAKEVENNINAFDCTALAAVPASYELMKGQMQDHFVPVLSRLRYFEFSAGSLSVRQRKEIVSLFPRQRIINTWGSSESGGAIFCRVHELAKDPVRVGSLGKPIEGVEVRVLDADGRAMEETDVEHPGRMSLRGGNILSGYWHNPQATADALRDGWLVTSDLVYRDDDGYVFMLGRADDIINTGGEKVSPIEVENIAGQYNDVKECAVIGAEDPVLGQAPVMFVSVGMGYREEAFRKYLNGKMEKYKQPREIVVLEALPRNRMQKLDKRAMRRIYSEGSQKDLMNPMVQMILNRRSIRKFQEKEIPRGILEMLVKTGYHAPSGHNMQSWQFTVVTSGEKIEEIREKTKAAAGKNRVHFFGFENPQALILVSNDRRNPDGCQDASCAAENIMLAAMSYGIGSVWLNPLMTLRDVEPAKTLLDGMGIPENHIVWSMIALGYPLSDSQQRLKKKENVVKWVE